MNDKIIDLLMNTAGMSSNRIILTMLICTILSIYVYFVYRLKTKSAFYSKTYNTTMALMGLITCSIIIAMQSNLVISLGMVGALSIVRFRTAVKDPMDLLFLFWSISIGIICGSQLFLLAIVVSLLVTILIFLLDFIPIKKPPYLLVTNFKNLEDETTIFEIVKGSSSYYKIKSKNISKDCINIIAELRTNNENELMVKLSKLGLNNISLVSHDGETRF